LHDLPSLQKFCSSRFGWPAAKTLEVAQELYDGQGKKIITYPRAEVRYLPKSLIKDVPRIVAGLRVGKSFGAIPVPEPPVIRKGASGSFYDKGDDAQLLPALRNGETARLQNPTIEDKETRPPPRYNEGTLIEAMQNAWRFVDDEILRERLKEAKGIGTPATRAEIIGGLKKQ